MPAQDLTVTTEPRGQATVIAVTGELDLSTVAALDAALDAAVGGPAVVVLTGCTFIDSSALQSLVRAQRVRREKGVAFGVVAPTQPAKRVLELSALDRVISVFDTVDEALTHAA